MKVIHKPSENKKLVAVVGSSGTGIFVSRINDPEGSVYLDWTGRAHINCKNLEGLLKEDSLRKPVYEGESVTLQF